jgi:hypothetical protein
MAEQHGGYRKPANPAPVSGPGKYSQRTDGGPADVNKQAQQKVTGMDYGDNKALNEIQSQGALAAAPGIPSAPSMPVQATPMPAPTPIPISAPTQNPSEPVTAGMPFGPGASTLPAPTPYKVDNSDDKQRALVILGVLQDSLNRGQASQGTVNLIRQLRSEL